MDQRTQKAFEFASETTKQLLTLSTAIIGVTISFAKDIVGSVGTAPKTLLMISWTLYVGSMLFGLATMMALTGTLEPQTESEKAKPLSIRGTNVKIPSLLQISLFLLATLIMVIAASLSGSTDHNRQPDLKPHSSSQVVTPVNP